ncbi:YceI family protein [Cognaticolwellia mytili]|uniref:YceI family protein n=1 Tax=Cognaticolwellia mytili TaxID=1888913 RepID=UPI000A1770AF|nr:YceI family protein [Cognaticolwellia mytili]
MRKSTLTLITILSFALTSLPSFAGWQLDNKNSLLNFVSVKKGTVAENHHFSALEGSIDKSGKVSIKVDLTSVDTNIAIRDERMKTFVFETTEYTSAMFTTQLDKDLLSNLKVGKSDVKTVTGNLSFHGQNQEVTIEVNVSKINTKTLLVSTTKPFFIKADVYGVVAGINKLKELAALPSIDYVVPVNFSVTFRH